MLASRSGESLDTYARGVNPQFVKILRTIGFDRTWARAEGAYLFDEKGNRFLDMLGGFGMYNVGRNNPRVRAALVEALSLDTPGMLAMGATLLPGGAGGDPTYTEGGVAHNYLSRHGVPSEAILVLRLDKGTSNGMKSLLRGVYFFELLRYHLRAQRTNNIRR